MILSALIYSFTEKKFYKKEPLGGSDSINNKNTFGIIFTKENIQNSLQSSDNDDHNNDINRVINENTEPKYKTLYWDYINTDEEIVAIVYNSDKIYCCVSPFCRELYELYLQQYSL
jgi:hypothetical protein